MMDIRKSCAHITPPNYFVCDDMPVVWYIGIATSDKSKIRVIGYCRIHHIPPSPKLGYNDKYEWDWKRISEDELAIYEVMDDVMNS